MGLSESATSAPEEWDNRKVFISLPIYRVYKGKKTFAVYLINVKFQRFEWMIWKRFAEIVHIHRRLRLEIPGFIGKYKRPSKRIFSSGLFERSEDIR